MLPDVFCGHHGQKAKYPELPVAISAFCAKPT
jgi:hypothetical protein